MPAMPRPPLGWRYVCGPMWSMPPILWVQGRAGGGAPRARSAGLSRARQPAPGSARSALMRARAAAARRTELVIFPRKRIKQVHKAA
jgi:hypothetical protein